VSLVMRLETAAEHYNRRVAKSMASYDFSAADMRELLLEAARRIKQLESDHVYEHEMRTGLCGND
jgi:hypothetical protein